jgi:hypothetical protein
MGSGKSRQRLHGRNHSTHKSLNIYTGTHGNETRLSRNNQLVIGSAPMKASFSLYDHYHCHHYHIVDAQSEVE